MYDYFLKAKNREEIEQKLKESGLLAGIDYSIDLIGDIPGKGRFHANLRLRQKLTSKQIKLFQGLLIDKPDNPKRRWF